MVVAIAWLRLLLLLLVQSITSSDKAPRRASQKSKIQKGSPGARVGTSSLEQLSLCIVVARSVAGVDWQHSQNVKILSVAAMLL
jgi:hypothetical protein